MATQACACQPPSSNPHNPGESPATQPQVQMLLLLRQHPQLTTLYGQFKGKRVPSCFFRSQGFSLHTPLALQSPCWVCSRFGPCDPWQTRPCQACPSPTTDASTSRAACDGRGWVGSTGVGGVDGGDKRRPGVNGGVD